MSPVAGVAVVLAGLVMLLGALAVWVRAARPHPEIPRKLAHVAMGLVTLTFPWLFTGPGPVIATCALAAVILISLRSIAFLRRSAGGVLGGVKRSTMGDLYFPLSVAAVFTLAGGDRVLYLVPVLLLTVADAAGALVGVFYGRITYAAADGRKSVEGSLAIFLAAFLSAHVPLLLSAGTGRLESLLIALILALLVTMLEAVAGGGLDNLLLPLGGWVLLRVFLDMDAAQLGTAFGVTTVLAAGIITMRRRTTLRDHAAIAAVLFAYAYWAMLGWPALVPSLTMLVTYASLFGRVPSRGGRPHGLLAVTAVGLGGMVWAALGMATAPSLGSLPFALSFASHLAFVGITRARDRGGRHATVTTAFRCAGLAWLLVVVPALLLERPPVRELLIRSAWSAGVLVLAGMVYLPWTAREDNFVAGHGPWVRRAVLAAIAAAMGLVPAALA